MSSKWEHQAIFYHVYPLGLCGAPQRNNFNNPVIERLEVLLPWIDHIQSLGVNALYLGPVFQSTSHGYDTVDYFQVDRRLGDIQTLARFSDQIHQRGLRLVLDGVFNHVGRDFWAFKDVLIHGKASVYRDWFHNLHFGESSPKGDPFTYESWHGHYSLVKLNLSQPDVRSHLFNAVAMWMDQFGIDGLRLDAADSIDLDFLKALHGFIKKRCPEFWLMGEVVHGDYRYWINPDTLDSVTNYECYKGLYSSLNETNYHEIAYSFERQFGENGMYQGCWLYNFVDNHDVDRVASKLKNPAHLFPLYILLFTMPGIPSIYYGSEWGIEGIKEEWSDALLRPAIDLRQFENRGPHLELTDFIKRLVHIRSASSPLQKGSYRQLFVTKQQFVFQRQAHEEQIIVALNSADKPTHIELNVPEETGIYTDLLSPGQRFQVQGQRIQLPLPSKGGRILMRC